MEVQQHIESFNYHEKAINEKIAAHQAKVNYDMNNVPVPKDLTELIAMLHEIFAHDYINADYVIKLMENYKSNPKDWRNYAKYDPHKYTRNLIDEGNGEFNILLLCWAESQGSSIHDHSNSQCFMKCLDGELVESKYEWPEKTEDGSQKEMVLIGKTVLKKEAVCYITDSIGLHRVENLSHSRPAVTLHVYVPAYKECQGFDQHTGKPSKCSVTFYSKYGKKI